MLIMGSLATVCKQGDNKMAPLFNRKQGKRERSWRDIVMIQWIYKRQSKWRRLIKKWQKKRYLAFLHLIVSYIPLLNINPTFVKCLCNLLISIPISMAGKQHDIRLKAVPS